MSSNPKCNSNPWRIFGGLAISTPSSLTYLFFGNTEWHRMRQRAQQIADGLSETDTVVYVEPFQDNITVPVRYARGVVRPKPQIALTRIEQVKKNLLVVKHSGIPGNSWIGQLEDYQEEMISARIVRMLKSRGIDIDLVWLTHPRQLKAMKAVPGARLRCYDCMDDWANLERPRDAKRFVKNELEILKKADLVFVTSRHLEAKCRAHNGTVVRVPNGVDIKTFRSAKPIDLRSAGDKRHVIGFAGNVGDWIDVGLLSHIAEERKEYVIAVVGPISGKKAETLRRSGNVILTGEVPHDKMAGMVKGFDVCVIPFANDKLTASINPIKMYEYLASGRPVVVTDFPEVEEVRSLIGVARNREEFLKLIDSSIEESDPAKAAKRIETAELNSWGRRCAEIRSAVQKALGSCS
jgi:glycosyltransferase involved in cell wall biosynthesis